MKTHTTHNKQQYYKIAFILIAVMCIIGFLIIANNKQKISNSNTPTSATEEQVKATQDKKKENDDLKSNDFNISTSSINISPELVKMRFIISDISNTGTCTLKLTMNNKIIIKSTSTQALSSASTCQGFNIERSEITDGVWNYNITVNISDKLSSSEGIIDVK